MAKLWRNTNSYKILSCVIKANNSQWKIRQLGKKEKKKRINIEAIRIHQEMLPWSVLYPRETHLGSHVIVYFGLLFLYFRFELFHGFFGTFTLFTAFIDQLFDFIVFVSAKGTTERERVSVKRYGSNNHPLISWTWMETLITSFIYTRTHHTYIPRGVLSNYTQIYFQF